MKTSQCRDSPSEHTPTSYRGVGEECVSLQKGMDNVGPELCQKMLLLIQLYITSLLNILCVCVCVREREVIMYNNDRVSSLNEFLILVHLDDPVYQLIK